MNKLEAASMILAESQDGRQSQGTRHSTNRFYQS
jgi:hypothetical protein